jgi:hypothetical protein
MGAGTSHEVNNDPVDDFDIVDGNGMALKSLIVYKKVFL